MDLPSGYTQLEYIESTGTQYIDTGFKPNQNSRVVMDAEMTVISGAAFYFGARASGYIDSFGVLYSNSAKAMRSAYGSENLTFTTTDYTARVIIDKNKTSCRLGTETLNHKASTFQNTHNLYLFASNEFGTVGSLSKMRLYSCQIYDNDTFIREYIPCVTDDGKVGLYDTVNGVFYGNAGTGSFSRGRVSNPELPKGFSEVEYIQATGTQYIDTGFSPAHNSRVVAEISDARAESCIFGARDTDSSTAANQFAVYITAASALRSDYFGTNKSATPSDITARTVIDKNANVTTGYGLTVSNTAVSGGSVSHTLYLLAMDTVGTVKVPASVKLYSCQIYDNGTLEHEYVPCISDSNEIGLYDIVGKQFYGNAGSGSFLRGKMLHPKLPSGFVRTEYIESTGTQYVDTGFINPNVNTRLVLDFESTGVPASNSGGLSSLFGARPAVSSNVFGVWIKDGAAYPHINDQTYDSEGSIEVETTARLVYDLDLKNSIFKVGTNSLSITPTAYDPASTIYSVFLFAINTKGSAEKRKAAGKLYSCHIYDNGVLVREFVPCKNSGGVGGLYDVLNGVFYGNAGSGEFLLGADIDVEPDPEPIPPEEFPTMIYDRTYADLARAKELAVIGYANMTDAEKVEWNGGLRGAYNEIDFNRVENAVLFLSAVLKDLPQEIRDFAAELGVSWDGFFDVPYSPDALNLKAKNTWKAGDIPAKNEKSRYLSNVVELRRTLDYETDMLPVSMDGLTIDGANAIEKALAFLHTEIDKFRQMRKTQIENTAAAWFFAGEIYTNEV